MSNTTPRSNLTQVQGTTNQYTLSPVLVGPSWKQLSIGSSHIVAIKSNDTLWSWGDNSSGQLGDGTYIARSSPVLIGGAYTWKSVSAGGSHSLAVRNDGLMFAWGQNSTGQVGNNGVPYSNIWKQISSVYNHTLLIRNDDTLWAVGTNTNGELGDGTVTIRPSPVQIGTSKYIAISAGPGMSFAITNDNRLFAWGYNAAGELGDGTQASRSSPVQIPGSWVQVCASASDQYANFPNHTGAINSLGQLFMWGGNSIGQLGDGTAVSRSSPVQIAVGMSFTSVAVGYSYTIALRTDKTLYGWGINQNGQQASDTPTERSSPVQISSLPMWEKISAGKDYAAGVTNTGALWAWGFNTTGQLGDGTIVTKKATTLIYANGIKDVNARGVSATMAIITTENRLLSTGLNTSGQLGDGTTVSKSTPVQIGNDSDWLSVQRANNGAVGLKTNGTLFGWGLDSTYQVYFGITDAGGALRRSSPVQTGAVLQALSPVQVGTSSWVSVSAGTDHSLAIRSDRTLWAFGNNSVGQLIQTGVVSASSPIQVGTSSYSQISAGNSFSLVVDSNGGLYAAGNNTYGQAGTALTTTTYSWTQVSSAAYHTLAIRSDGLLFAWGTNTGGQLGLGDTITRSSPTQVGSNSWISVSTDGASNSTGSYFSVAVRSDGTVWSWGSNTVGQLGDNTTVNKSSPVQVLSGSGFTKVATAVSIGVAIGSNGMWAWGVNLNGGLGDGTTINRSSPVQVNTFSWSQIAASYYSFSAIRNDGMLFTWGYNFSGELGTNDILPRSVITQISTSSWTQVYGRTGGVDNGYGTFWAVRADGVLFGWGANNAYLVGDGTSVNRSSPVQVGAAAWNVIKGSSQGTANVVTATGLRSDGSLWVWGSKNASWGADNTTTTFTHSWIQVSSNYEHTLMLRGDYTLWSSGFNTSGQLGLNDATSRSSPVQVGTSAWRAISAGGEFSLAIDSNNLLYSWGSNTFGKLGLADSGARSVPVLVNSLQYSKISAGVNHALAIDTTGGLYTWGSNSYRQLGQITTMYSNALSWTSIQAGLQITTFIRNDGLLFTTGLNNYGQIGNGTTTDKSSPTQIGSGSWLVAVPTQENGGREMVVAINSAGKLFTWGASINGLLGDSSTNPRSSPVQIGNSSWSQIATSNNTIFAIRADNTLWVWGRNENGSFGIPTYNQAYSSPIQIGTNTYSKITVNKDASGTGLAYGLAIDTLGKLYAWGSNASGALGQDSSILTSWTYTASGNNANTFAISADGTLFGWGLNNPPALQFNDGSASNKSSPVVVGLFPSVSSHVKFSKVAPGYDHAYAIATDGSLYGWGQPPVVSGLTYTDPIVPLLPSYSWSQLAGGVTVLAIRSDGLLFGWGNNSFGAIGDGTSSYRSAPVQIGNSSWTAIAASGYGYQSLAIDAVGRLFAWGFNTNGQLGDNTTTNKNSPIQIGLNYSWTKVASSAAESYAIRSDGLLFGWGANTNGALGQGDTIRRSSPVQITSRKFIDIAAADDANGNSTLHMIRDDYLMFAVGKNSVGQLGEGTTIDRSTPVQIGASSWTMVRPGAGQVAAIDTSGRLFTWGGYFNASLGTTSKSWTYVSLASGASMTIDSLGRMFGAGDNSSGQLGDGTIVLKSNPVQVGVGTSWIQVAIGATHTIAVASGGSLWSWGRGASGQLGNNTTVDRSSPVQISADSYTKIRAGQAANGAINSQGQLFMWGDNSWGLMGDSTTVNKSQPIQIGIGISWVDVYVGTSHAAALTADNRLFVWGANGNGQLGQNNTIHRSSPVQVAGSWSQITLGGNGASYALDMSGTLYAWGFNSDGQLGQNDTLNRSSPVQVSAGYPGSLALTGSGSSATTTTINFGAGLFTVEGWFFRTNTVGTTTAMWGTTNGTGVTAKLQMGQLNTGQLYVYGPSGILSQTTSTTLIPQNTWVHVAAVRDNVAPAVIKIYVNGQEQSLSTANPSLDWTAVTGTFNIGADGEAAWAYWNGSVSNFRVVTGATVYTGNFTVPTTPLQPSQSSSTNINAITVSQTQLLVASNAPNIYDASSAHRPITLANASYSGNSPLSFKWTQIIGGYQTLHAKATNNTLWGWGYNFNGQLAMNDSISRSSPVQLAGFSSYIVNLNTHNFIQHAAMANMMGVIVNNDLLMWGYNTSGGLGDGTTIAKSNPIQIGADIFRSSPVQVGSLSWTNVSANWYSMVGVTTDGVLRGWGYNLLGQLGTGDRANRGLPTVLSTTAPSKISSSGVGNTTFYIYSDGSLYSVGSGSAGVLGYNGTVSRSMPVQIATEPRTMTKVLNGSSFTQVTTYLHTAVIKTDGTLWSWGYNNYGQLGDGTTISKLSPIQVPGSWSQVSINEFTTVGLKNDGTLWAWGDNTYGQFADTTTVHRSSPVQLIAGSSFTQIAANWRSVYAIKPDFKLWSWGFNTNGQLGDNTTVNKSSPVQLTASDGTVSWTQVSALGQTVIMQGITGSLYSAGLNTGAQLGDNTLASRSVPVQLAGPLATSGVFILPANNTYDNNQLNARAIVKNGRLFAWGVNSAAQIGDLTTATASSAIAIASTFAYTMSPVQIGTSSWSQVSAGSNHVAAITTDNKMFTWGGNAGGQLGRAADYISISTGSNTNDPVSTGTQGFTMYIRGDGTMFGIGLNSVGQLGDSSTISRSSPVQIGAAGDWKVVAVGAGSAGGWGLAIKQNGTLWAWGSNPWGQHGTGNVTSTSSPVAVSGVGTERRWVSIAAQQEMAVAVDTSGQLWAWGNNNVNVAVSAPVRIGTDSDWSKVFSGTWARHAFILKNNGTLYAWGSNTNGRLGVGDTINKSVPTQIPGSWIMASVGGTATNEGSTSYGIKSDYTMWGWGQNTNGVGDVGDGSGIDRSSPVQIGATQAASWLAVYGVVLGAQALASDGTLWYWSRSTNVNGITDWTGSTIARATPTLLSKDVLFQGYTNWDRYRLGRIWPTQTGALYVWGPNNTGLLGQGDTISRSSPVQLGSSLASSYLISQVQGSWSQVSAGVSATVATRTDNTLWAWGINANGQISDNTTISRSSPVQIGNNYWVRISSNAGDHVAGIKADGSLWVWGNNVSGGLGLGNTISRSSPVQLGTSSWTQVFANARATHAIDSSGRLFAWGNNTFGQLGLNDTVSRSSPVQIGVALFWTQLTGGAQSSGSNQEYTVALNSLGQLFTWGCNVSGQLGDNATVNRSSPVQIMTTSSFTAVSSSNFHTMALSIGKGLFLFGSNQFGQLGDGTVINRSSPVQVGTSLWTNVAAGTSNSAAIDVLGGLYTWGAGTGGGLGDGTTVDRSSPVRVGTSIWANLYSNGLGFAASPPGYNRTLYVWGVNAGGQLGNNSTVNLSSITLMDNSIGWTSITGGADGASNTGVTLGIDDGKLFAWGYNGLGILGQNDTISRSSPTQIGTFTSWTTINAGNSMTAMIRSDGQLFRTGINVFGQLGVLFGNVAGWSNVSSPVQVGSSYVTLNAVPTKLDNNSYTQVSAGEFQSMSIRNDSTLWGWGLNNYNAISDANTPKWNKVFGGGYLNGLLTTLGELYLWGLNNYGQLGDNTVTARPGPRKLDNNSWTTIGVGTSYIVAIKADGTLWSWGQNTHGGLGDGTTIDKSSPVQIGTSNNWTQVDAGYYTTLALNSLGQLYTWGYNASGQLGQTSTVSRSSPVQVPGSWMTLGISGDGAQTFGAIKPDYTLWMWGYGTQGQMGDRTTVAKSSPVQVSGSWTQVITPYQVAGLRTDGTVWTWGDNSYGQLGQTSTVSRSSPIQINSFNYKQVAGSQFHTVLLRSDDTAWTFGLNNNGQLGDNSTINRSSPVQVSTSGFTYISATGLGSRFIFLDNSVAGSGQYPGNETVTSTSSLVFVDSSFIQLSSNPISLVSSPTQIGTSWTSVSTNFKHSMAIKPDGTLWGWGVNSEGQLGYVTPTTVLGLGIGAYINSDGTLWSWGLNVANYPAVGDGTTISRSSAVQIIAGSNTSWTNIATIYNAQGPAIEGIKIAIDTVGRMYTWGNNTYGQLGNNTVTTRSFPTQIGHTRWTAIATPLAIKEDGTLWSWGQNSQGTVGDGTTIARSSPVQIGFSSWSSIGCNYYASHAIRLDGTLWGWGENLSVGHIGDGTTVSKSSPVQIGALANWSTLSNLGTAAINNLGQLFAWGLNSVGQLGDNTTASRSSPVQIGAGTSYVAVSSSGDYTLMIDMLGRLFSTGNNSTGLLGDGTTINRSSPVQVGTSSWVAISAGSSVAYAIRNDGTLWAWGYNAGGILGDGTTTNKSSPVQIGTDTWQSIYAGQYSVYGVRNNQLYGWGLNNNGVLGLNDTLPRTSPVLIGSPSIISVLLVTGDTISINSVGGLVARGGPNTANGYLGIGDTIARSSPVQIGTSGMSWVQISAGMGIAGAIKEDKTLWMWGVNSFGSLGQNDTIARSRPVQITGSWNQVAVVGQSGQGYAFGIRSDYTLWTWGWNPNGAAGTNDNGVNRSSPVQIGASSWSFVTAGANYASGGIDINGRLFMWGGLANNYGVGDNTNAYRSSPVQIMTGRSFTQLAIGESVAAAIDTNGTLWTWGQNGFGECGVNDTTPRSSPVQVGTSSWIMVKSAGALVVAVLHNGYQQVLYGWGGASVAGWLGDGTTVNKSSPVQIAAMYTVNKSQVVSSPVQIGVGNSWLQVSVGSYHTVALRNDYTLWSWGMNFTGQLGTDNSIYRSSPVQVAGSWTFANAGGSSLTYGQTFGVTSNGLIWAWGQGNYGQTAVLNSTISRSTPTQIITGSMGSAVIYPINLTTTYGTSYTQLASAFASILATKPDNVLYTWGVNTYNTLGQNIESTLTITSPTTVGNNTATYQLGANKIGNSSWSVVSAGATHAQAIDSAGRLFGWGNFAGNPSTTNVSWRIVKTDFVSLGIRYDGTLWAWGYGGTGQLGQNNTISRSSPVQIGTDTDWKDVIPSSNTAAAIKNDGRLYTWGYNNVGQLGDNTFINRSSPVQVPGSWTQVSLGAQSAMGQQTDGTWWTWGQNTYGELGLNGTVNRYSPVFFPGNWKSIKVGFDHMTGVLYDGTLWAWGKNDYGQLGLNDTVSRSAPIQIGLSTWDSVYAGYSYSVALRTDKTIWAWGINTANELGDATLTNRSSPVQIGTSLWNSIITGPFFSGTFAFDINGNLYGWGRNANGQVGLPVGTNVSSPVLIGSGISFVQVSGGFTASGIDIDGKLYVWGSNQYGAFGDNTTVNKSSPTLVTNGINNITSSPVQTASGSWVHVNAGVDFSVAVDSNQSLYFWGKNDKYQTGTSNPARYISSPVQIGSNANDTGAGNGTAGVVKNI